MGQTVRVLVVEDNEYYNSLIYKALQQSEYYMRRMPDYRLILHSYVSSCDCISSIRSREFRDDDVIAFVESNMGDGISGDEIIRMLKKENNGTTAVLLSPATGTGIPCPAGTYDFCVKKDVYGPAICRLFLDQFIENKFL